MSGISSSFLGAPVEQMEPTSFRQLVCKFLQGSAANQAGASMILLYFAWGVREIGATLSLYGRFECELKLLSPTL